MTTLGAIECTWSDLAAAPVTLDVGAVATIAAEILDHRPRAGERDVLEARLEAALLEHFGRWVIGWNRGASEPGAGGPIRSWCCAPHSIFAKGESGAARTIARVVAAVTEWHLFIRELEREFAELRMRTQGRELRSVVEQAAATLVDLVIERNSAEDAWYSTASTLLRWFLESGGFAPARYEIDRVFAGRFQSWCAPTPETINAAAAEVGQVFANHEPKPVVDSTAAWRAIRSRPLENAITKRLRQPVIDDAHARYIAKHDAARDPERARRMNAALTACRTSALRDEPLTLERLTGWQATVVGGEAARLRNSDAFARNGAVRYAYSAALEQWIRDALVDANSDEAPAARAARVFLDICFLHPFVDGNSRAARLALDHVLTRAGLGLHSVEPLFSIAREAEDVGGAFHLAHVIDLLSGLRT